MARTISACPAVRPHEGWQRCPTYLNGEHRCRLVLTDHPEGRSHDPHRCTCGHTWTDGPSTPLVCEVVATRLQPGDLLVIESDERLDDAQYDTMRRRLVEQVGDDVWALVLDRAHLVGVLRTEAAPDELACGVPWTLRYGPCPQRADEQHRCKYRHTHMLNGMELHRCACGMTAEPIPVPDEAGEVEEAADLYKRGNMHIVAESGEDGSGDGAG